MYGSLDISVSGMVAQRTRLDTIAANIANTEAIADPSGDPNPFRRRIAVFQAGDPHAATKEGRKMGVHVGSIMLDQGEFRKMYDPSHPFAQQPGRPDAGYVYYPNIDPVTENVNAVDAIRAYEANVAAAEAAKSMMAQALRLIA